MNSKIHALIDLLDDPDNTVYELVERELLKEKQDIIAVLEDKWENSFDVVFQERIENIIQNIQFRETRRLLKSWLKTAEPERDLLSGFLIVDRFQYPDINPLRVHHKIEKLRKTIWLELNNSLTLLEKSAIINHYLYQVNGFSLNLQNMNSPQNCFLNQVLDLKKANPVSMSLLYTIVARLLGMPAQFVDFPKNPLVAIVDPKMARKVHGKEVSTDVLFYINPSNKGSITSIKEIEYHLKSNQFFPVQYYTEPKSDIYFIERLLESLDLSYQSANFGDKRERVQKLLELF